MRHQHLPCLIEIKAGVSLSQITHLHSPEPITLDYYTVTGQYKANTQGGRHFMVPEFQSLGEQL